MAAINDLIAQIENPELRARIQAEVDRMNKQKKFGLVFEEHLPECTPLYDIPVKRGALVALKTGKVSEVYRVLKIKGDEAECKKKDADEIATFKVNELVTVAEFGDAIYPYLKPMDSVCNAPDSDLWHTLIEADNYHALQLLEYLYAGKVDCIYIDPPYNTGATDWKYNNDYVDGTDAYRHSKWLSMIQKRLKIAKKLLNPKDSVLIVTIDEKEYLHLGCLLEEMFSEATIQMVTTVISGKGVSMEGQFSRVEEYIFIVTLGEAKLVQQYRNMLNDDNEEDEEEHIGIEFIGLRRRNTSNYRESRPNQFYPFFVDETDGHIVQIGDVVPHGIDRNTIIVPEGCVALWPLDPQGRERIWGLVPDSARTIWKEGCLKVTNWNTSKKSGSVKYLASGTVDKIRSGAITITERDKYGAIVDGYFNDSKDRTVRPRRVWNMKSHNASTYGTLLLKNFLVEKRFSYPKSLYAVVDTLKFYLANKPRALVVDFFAGSGTTLHAVNLLNAEDDGNRRCIMVTNNEVSAAEAEILLTQGYHPGDDEWEKLGIARYVTWPRTICSINGVDVYGNTIAGNYGFEEEEFVIDNDLSVISKTTGKPIKKSVYIKKRVEKAPKFAEIKKSDGFKTNAVFFKLGFLDKTAVALGRQFKEMLPTLWMKAGAIGKCPTISEDIPDMLILPENKFAVLIDETSYMIFEKQISEHPEIETIYIVTDSEPGYREMIAAFEGKNTYQLYRNYLDNFRINTGR